MAKIGFLRYRDKLLAVKETCPVSPLNANGNGLDSLLFCFLGGRFDVF